MNTKIILFDIDGVMICPENYFEEKLESDGYVGAKRVLEEFFVDHNTACTEGRVNIEDVISPYLQRIGWDKSVESFLREKYENEAQYFDSSFTSIVQDLQSKGVICCLASAQEKPRAEYFLKTFGFDTMFDGHYISCDIGYRKNMPEYWNFVLRDIENMYGITDPSQIAFFDDAEKNVNMASNSGIQGFVFTDMEQFKKDMGTLGFIL